MPGPRSPRALSAARCRLPGWLHAVFTAISHCPRGTAFCLPQCLVAVLFPALDAPVPVLAGGKAVAAPGVATAVRAGPRTAWSRSQPRTGDWADPENNITPLQESPGGDHVAGLPRPAAAGPRVRA